MTKFFFFAAIVVLAHNVAGQRFQGSRPPYPQQSMNSKPEVAPAPLPPQTLPPVVQPIHSGPMEHANAVIYATTINNFVCPQLFGRYPMQGQCDQYVECVKGVAHEEMCPDGLVFNPDADHNAYPCVYKNEISCAGREKLQPANATAECPHQFGYFKIGGSNSCGKYLNCMNGRGIVADCPEGLAFNSETSRCDWPDQVHDCDSEAYLGFKCPPAPQVRSLSGELIDFGFRFYRNEMNCQHYYLCVENGVRLLGCDNHQAFDEYTNRCEDIETVTTCPMELRKVRSAERFFRR